MPSLDPALLRAMGSCVAWLSLLLLGAAAYSPPTNGSCLLQTAQATQTRGAIGLSVNASSRISASCPFQSHCEVPAGETWVLDQSMDVASLTIRGTLEWDTTQDDLTLRAGYVVVDNGHLKVGTREAPMSKRATIHIKKGQTHPQLGTRVLGGLGSARIDIHGRQLQRTWTLLSRTAFAGSTQLFVKDDPELMGWRAGDRIGVATTSRGHSGVYTIREIAAAAPEPPSCPAMPDVKKTCSTTRCRVLATHMQDKSCAQYCARSGLACVAAHEEQNNDCTIMANMTCKETWPGTSDLLCECRPPPHTVQPHANAAGMKVLHLQEPLADEHWGGWREVAGRRLEMAAEVVNLERSVLITGDHDDFHRSNQGLHTIIAGTGYMDVRYTRVEYCGQRDLMGRYCMHFHLMRRCPSCVFEGNAVVESAQVGITIHGTHDSTVLRNVVWNGRAVGIYTEDGNEMNNLIKQNVMICSHWRECSVDWLSHVGLYAGIYLIGMTNDLIENRVAGHENCIWTPGGSRGNGHGAALGKVCPMYTPFGEIRGNVNHDCQRFGLYLDSQFPRNVKRDENGYVTDFASCQKFTVDGADNGLQPPNVVRDEFDWHNMFVGQYNMGDVQFVNYTGVNNFHSMYWKSSKDFADGRLWHVTDSAFLNDPSDPIGHLQFFGPGGPHVFGLKNTIFAGGPVGMAALCAGQHCGLGAAGGPCNSQYLLEGVDFSGLESGGQRIRFGVHSTDAGEVLPVFLARDGSLGGFRSMVSPHLNGFSQVSGCSQVGSEWGSAIGCSQQLRRLNVWGPDSGDLSLSGPGYTVRADNRPPTLGMNAGRMLYEATNGKGYGAPVLVGGSYSLSPRGHRWSGDLVVDFSDRPLAAYFGDTTEGVSLTIGGGQCALYAYDDRRFLSPQGPVPRILDTHTRIQGGTLRCAEHTGGTPAPPPPSACSQLRDVVETCSPDGCKVLAGGMSQKSCSAYCGEGSLHCTGAWEAAGDGCAAVLDAWLGCDDQRPADNLICQCGPEPAPRTTPTQTTTTTLLPPGVPGTTRQPSGTRSPGLQQCEALPDVKQVCSADGCKVLAGSMTGLTCAEYCARSSLECVGAWEEEANDCRVKATMACDEVWPGTSDLLCQCAAVASTTLAPGTGPTPAPPPLPAPECSLPDVKEFCSANGCKVLASPMSGRTCEDYCAENDLVCAGAWEEVDDTCQEEFSVDCNAAVSTDAEDMICECTRKPSKKPKQLPSTNPSWVHRQGVNCYDGHGARGIAGKSPLPGRYLLEDCKRECEAVPECEGVVMVGQLVLDQQPYFCWLNTNVRTDTCLRDTDYDFWQRMPTSSAHAPLSTNVANIYSYNSTVGGFGGWCTCPDGQRYLVGDVFDACANGPASLACFGGTPGSCERHDRPIRRGMQVTCAPPSA